MKREAYIAGLVMVMFACVAATLPPVPVPGVANGKSPIAKSAPTQGAGAAAQLAGIKVKAAVVIPPRPVPVIYFTLAPEMRTNCQLSVLAWTNTAKADAFRAAWDWGTNWVCATPPTNNPYTNYLLWGWSPAALTNVVNAGTNSSVLVLVVKTNVVLTVTSLNATNLQWSADLRHWSLLGATNYCATNGPSRPFWRGMGKSKSGAARVFLSRRYQL